MQPSTKVASEGTDNTDGPSVTSPGSSTSPASSSSSTATECAPSDQGSAGPTGGRFIDFYFADAFAEGYQPGFIPVQKPPNNARAKDRAAAAKSEKAESEARGGMGTERGTERPTGIPRKARDLTNMSGKDMGGKDMSKDMSGMEDQQQAKGANEAKEAKGVNEASKKVAAGKGRISSVLHNGNERRRVYRDEDQSSPVVSVQADNNKILAAYEDGTIKSWGVRSMSSLFDLKGRTPLIANVQVSVCMCVCVQVWVCM